MHATATKNIQAVAEPEGCTLHGGAREGIGGIGAPAEPHEDPAGIRHVRSPLALEVWEKTEAVATWTHHAPRLGQHLGCPAEPPPDHFRRPRHVWPETPMPRISIPAAPARACRTAATVASIHQDGYYSFWPGASAISACSARPTDTTRPVSESTRTALVLWVPLSIPR